VFKRGNPDFKIGHANPPKAESKTFTSL